MKIKILIIFIFFGFCNAIVAQEKVDKDEMVGFACYWEGSPSKTVNKVTQTLKNKNYSSISKLLTSDNNAERFLAVVILEKLSDWNKYTLSETEKKLISQIKHSNELVSVCSGCTYFKKVELKTMFSKDMLSMTKDWLKKILDENKSVLHQGE